MIEFTSLLAHPDRSPRERIGPVALALLPYSSGTTGLAKGVMLTPRACLANVVQMLTAAPAARTDRSLAVASFFHAVAWSCAPAGPCSAARSWSRCPGSR